VVRYLAGTRMLSLRHHVKTGSETQLASSEMGTRVFSPGIKRPEPEADHSPPSWAEVKNAWSYTSISPLRLHGVAFSYAQEQL
jgi:hypothetical protein